MRRGALAAGMAVLVLLIVGAGFRQLTDNRLKQLDYQLRQSSFIIQGGTTFNITARLRLLRQRIAGGESLLDTYKTEAQLQSLASGLRLYVDEDDGVAPDSGSGGLYRIIGRLVGRPTAGTTDATYQSMLDEAFYWERNRLYDQAIVRYESLLGMDGIPERTMDGIRLHIAFCRLMTADYDGAEKRCLLLLERSHDREIIETSRDVLDFIDEIRQRSALAASGTGDDFTTGRDSYFNVDFLRAVSELEAFIREHPGHDLQSEARYYKGRSHEELGEVNPAVDEYRRILLLGESDQWSVEARKRLQMLRAFYDTADVDGDLLESADFTPDNQSLQDLIDRYQPLVVAADPATRGASDSIDPPEAATTGELLIISDPAGASITVNGRSIGPGPVFVDGIPYGTVLVEAELDGRLIRHETTVSTPDIMTVNFAFEAVAGSLVLDNRWTAREVYIDDSPVVLHDSLIADLKPGRHILTVIGYDRENMLMRWENFVMIQAGETILVTVP